jgi:glutathione synthase/RimK-type ligase-like ATP-grasp enzyme
MILLCGIPSESPLSMVLGALQQLKAHHFIFNQRNTPKMSLDFELRDGKADGVVEYGDETYWLHDFQGAYVRLMDDRFLPELKGEANDSQLSSHSRSLHASLNNWLEVADARVVSRPSAMMSNNSKPYQAQLIQKSGLRVPDTLITNDPDLVVEFWQQHRQIIYKSISGVRSIVRKFKEEDLQRLDKIRWCPVQFQEYIDGVNIRVHVVGNEVFPTLVRSDATDYRYAEAEMGKPAELVACDLPADSAQRCIDLAASLNLPFAGIDLKVTPEDEVFCFEVNPCPGFSYYESHTGQPIAMAVARYLTGRSAA